MIFTKSTTEYNISEISILVYLHVFDRFFARDKIARSHMLSCRIYHYDELAIGGMDT